MASTHYGTGVFTFRGAPIIGDTECVGAQEHRRAWAGSYTGRLGFGSALRSIIGGWAGYAIAYKAKCGSFVGEDGVFGPEWQAIGHALLGLLNGELGGWDGGSLDANIRDCLKANGCEPEK